MLYLNLGLTDKRLQGIVCRTAMDIMTNDHSHDGDISAMSDIERKRINDNFKIGLNYLQDNEIIRFSEEQYMYRIVVLNEYRLDQLIGELKWLETYVEGVSGKTPPALEDKAFYERSTGNIIINGKQKTLKGTNKKLFDALYVANPECATRSSLLRIIGEKKREQSSGKIALNEAFSNLRKACGVTSETISLSQKGGKLHARVAQLIEADEIYLSNFLTS